MKPLVLISDNNANDIYNSVLKYCILNQHKDFQIFEYYIPFTNNRINNTAAYILLNEHYFPENTIFFIEINISEFIKEQKILLIYYNKKWILTPDSGLLGLLEKDKIEKIFFWKEYIQNSFYAKNEMLNALKHLVNKDFSVHHDFSEISYENCKKIYWPSITERTEKDERRLILPLIHIDSYNNLIFLFKKEEYEKYREKYNITIKLPLGDSINEFDTTYNHRETTQPMALFGDAGYLEIAANGEPLAPLIANKNIYTGTSYSVLLILKSKK